MRLQDALFNWLQMKIVCEGRPDDEAAEETLHFFETILREDHDLTDFGVAESDSALILLHYTRDGDTHRQTFDREAAEQLLFDIESNPVYNSSV